jgi:hypothetical protein
MDIDTPQESKHLSVSKNLKFIHPFFDEFTPSKIPRILHLIWVGTQEKPVNFNFYVCEWKRLMPEWEIRVWENKDINNTEYWQLKTNPTTVTDQMSTRPKDLEINDAILIQAEAVVPRSGYDVVKFYVVATNDDGTPADPSTYTADYTLTDASRTVSNMNTTPSGDGYTDGYLTGDGKAPNGLPVTAGVNFPFNPKFGDYALRLDYFPNRLFRYNGKTWAKIEDNVRTQLTPGSANDTLRSSFVNNTYTTPTNDYGNIPSRQSLSQALQPKADNGDQGGNKPIKPYPPTQPDQKSS